MIAAGAIAEVPAASRAVRRDVPWYATHLMRSARHITRLASVAALVAVATVVPVPGVSGIPASPVAHAADGLGAGGEYHPLTPARVYDSRPGLPGSEHDVSPIGAKPISTAGSTFDVQLLGRGGVPATPGEVLGVVVNITVTEPTSTGFLNAYGKNAPAGTAAIVNFVAGQTVPNLAIVRPGDEGKLTILLKAGTGSAHVVVDVFGWFSTSSSSQAGARLVPVTPGRVLDTRTGLGRASTSPLAAGEFTTLKIRGADAVDPPRADIVPDDSKIVGVVLNMAGVNNLPTSAATHLSVVPSDLPSGAKPSTANLNLSKGQVKSNMVIVPVDPADGSIRIYNNSATTHVVLDVVGYLVDGQPATTRAGRVVPLSAPYRVFDTREQQWNGVPLGPGQAEDWSFADFAGSVTIGGVAVGKQLGVIGNLTSASLTRQYPQQPVGSYLTVYPSDAERPTSANLNMVENQITPNMVIMKYSTTISNGPLVRVYNYAGFNHYIYDASAVILSD